MRRLLSQDGFEVEFRLFELAGGQRRLTSLDVVRDRQRHLPGLRICRCCLSCLYVVPADRVRCGNSINRLCIRFGGGPFVPMEQAANQQRIATTGHAGNNTENRKTRQAFHCIHLPDADSTDSFRRCSVLSPRTPGPARVNLARGPAGLSRDEMDCRDSSGRLIRRPGVKTGGRQYTRHGIRVSRGTARMRFVRMGRRSAGSAGTAFRSSASRINR